MSYKKFRCQNEECINANQEEDEDNRLVLHVIEGEDYQYRISDDGHLEHYDSEGTGQDTYLECELCGSKYDFDSDYFELKWQHVLPMHSDDVKKLGLIKRKEK